MLQFIIRTAITVLLIILSPSLCLAKDFPELIGKSVLVPDGYVSTTDYTLIHIIRNQKCTKCSVSSLYQWDDVIAMIGRNDMSYFYIVETRPEDTPETISEALKRRPFSQPMFVDYSRQFLETNQWLKKRRYREINDFVLDRRGTIVKIGDPLNDFQFFLQIKNME